MNPIDLRSDTVTQPDAAMRESMLQAELGDDVYGEDPTVNRLQEMAAQRLGKQAALFVPSGTMANQIALRAHTEAGDAAIAGRDVHTYLYESGAAAALSGIHFTLIGEGGFFDAEQLRAAVYPRDAHFPITRLVCVENTHNRSGGRVFPRGTLQGVTAMARELGLRLHLDGARLFNAEIKSGVAAASWAADFDSVSICLSKGLGAPVGSLLAGSREFIERAHRFRKMFGGGMRQAGILAAAGIYALEHNVKRLADDHANAARLAEGIASLSGLSLGAEPETNMVVIRCAGAGQLSSRLREREILINPISQDLLRAVTHLDVSRSDVDRVVDALRELS